jgi:hypothetical protein
MKNYWDVGYILTKWHGIYEWLFIDIQYAVYYLWKRRRNKFCNTPLYKYYKPWKNWLNEIIAHVVVVLLNYSFSSGRNVSILSGVDLNANIFQTIHRMETEIASFERGKLPLSNDTNFKFIASLVDVITA